MRFVVLALVLAAVVTPAVAQETVLLGVLEMMREVYVDSVLLITEEAIMHPTPDFGGSEETDTFNFGPFEEPPHAATIHYTFERRMMEPVEIDPLQMEELSLIHI